jgi:acyl carrier protein
MDRAVLLSKLRDIVTTDPTAVVGEEFVLTHKNWDSMAILSALLVIEEVAGLQMEGEPLAGCRCVKEVLDAVETEWQRVNESAAGQQ